MLDVIHEYDVAVPMRDGALLRGTLFRPSIAGRFPALVMRSPYGPAKEGYETYVRSGYALYVQDTRGRYSSDGEYHLLTSEKHREREDGFDTVEWLAAQEWCDGRVGQLGASYGGFTTWMTASAKPPHLIAMNAETMSPEMADVDFTGGSFRPARRIRWWLCSIAPDIRRRAGMSPPHTPAEAKVLWSEQKHVHWLGLLPWAEIVHHLPASLAEDVATWLKDPAQRTWCFEETVYPHLEIPNLDIIGWYDNSNSSLAHLVGMQQLGATELARQQSKVVIGPWSHGSRGQRQWTDVDFGPNAEVDLVQMRIQWFDHWMKGLDNGVEEWPAVQYFEMGSRRWRSANTWPPLNTSQNWYLSSKGENPSGALITQVASITAGDDQYLYNPHDPMPTLWDSDFTQALDRRKLEYRADLLRYRSEPLHNAVTIAGDPQVLLYASSSAPDTDFFAWLIDEAPDGTTLEISSGMVRARHRNGLDKSELLQSDQVTEFRIKLRPTANCFLPGHRIRLEISSSDFPNFDRNHNTGGDDLRETTFQCANQTVFCGGSHLSHIVLPLRDKI